MIGRMSGANEPSASVLEAAAWVRKQLLDDAHKWTERFVTAMRAENISDETAARVVNRMLLGVPDPDEVIRPADTDARCDDVLHLHAPWAQRGGSSCP